MVNTHEVGQLALQVLFPWSGHFSRSMWSAWEGFACFVSWIISFKHVLKAFWL